MGNKKIVCPCLKICRGDIEEAIDNGASNFKDVKKKTKIVTKCGKCKTRAKCLVREIFAEKDLLIEGKEGVCLGCQGDFFEPEDENTLGIMEEREESCFKAKQKKKSACKKRKKLRKKNSERKKEKEMKEKASDCKKQKKPKEKKSGFKEEKKSKEKKSKEKKSKEKKSFYKDQKNSKEEKEYDGKKKKRDKKER